MLTFLIGSGVSCAAGLPGTAKLTHDILSPSNEVFNPFEPTETLSAFMQLLAEEQSRLLKRLGNNRPVNYEDICYLAAQIADSEVGEFENAAVEAFVDKLARELMDQEERFKEPGDPAWGQEGYWRERVYRLAVSSVRTIKQTVARELTEEAPRPDALRGLTDAAGCGEVNLDVFTLNHDRLLETLWNMEGISFEDGFRPVADVRSNCYLAAYPEVTVWSAQAYDAKCSTCPSLLKLHGSIDWWSLWHPDVDFLPPAKVKGDPLHILARPEHRAGSKYLPPAELEPVILVGTFNKMLHQARGDSFLDLLCLFRRRLAFADRLVISGYGFGDKGINGIIIEWLTSPDHRALLIDPAPEDTLDRGRGAVQSLVRAKTRGQLTTWTGGFEDFEFPEVLAWAKRP